MTQKDRVFTVLWAIAFLLLGAAMIIWPDAVAGYIEHQHTRSLLDKVALWLWGRPVGIFLVILCPLSVWYKFTKSKTKKTE
jgi:hypothetical protein